MNKTVLSLSAILMFAFTFKAQDSNDDKVRFGLRVTPQPTWFKGDKNNISDGARFGIGFGLNMEFRISGVAAFLTGIGGDFEGGKYTFKTATNYEAKYWLDENNEFVDPTYENRTLKSNTAYVLKARTVKTTHVTIPVILKLSTKEYSGIKYFGMFGGEVGIKVKSTATDSYLEARKYSTDSIYTVYDGEESISDININKETIPVRIGLNAGIGAEYRIAGSTSLFMSINYFTAFTNLTRKESQYMIYKTDNSSHKSTFVDQKIKMNGIRINIGIMF